MPKDKTKRFAFTPYSNNEDNPFTVYGLVEITPENARRLLTLIEELQDLRARHPDEGVFKITAFDYIVWLEPDGCTDAERRATEEEQREITSLTERLNSLREDLVEVTSSQEAILTNTLPLCSMDVCTLEVLEDGVRWSGIVKHTSVKLSSPTFTIDALKGIAGRKAKKAA